MRRFTVKPESRWVSRGLSALCILACALGALTARPAELTIKVALPVSQSHLIGKMSILMGQEIERRLPGRVDWQIFYGGELGTVEETMLGLMQGTHMITMNGGWFQNISPDFAVFDTPFMFRNRDEARRVIAAIQDDLARAILPKGIVLIGIGDLGFREISNNVRPIVKPADLRGISIRTPGDPYSIETFRALGADPIPMEVNELYLAMREGVVDGQENPIATIWNLRYYEVQRYVSLSNHVFSPIFIGVSALYWQRWPEDVRRAVREAAQVACDFSFRDDERSERTLRETIEAANPRIRFNDIDRAAFERALAPLIAERRRELAPEIWRKVAAVMHEHQHLASLH